MREKIDPERNLKESVAWACRILAMDGHADLTLGHVSARGPFGQIYMKPKDIGLNEVLLENINTIDLDCNKIAGYGDVHLEAVMHTEAYRIRADIQAVVHTHPPYATALSATEAALDYVNHDSVLFFHGLGIFDETAALILDKRQGELVAKALGENQALLMSNHGILVVGRSVPWAVYTAITLERAARIQAIASSLGALKPIPQQIVQMMKPEKYREEFVIPYWEYLKREARRRGFADGMAPV